MTGKLIVLDGIDGSGKATQVKLLYDALSQLTKVTIFDFPRYEESLFGKLIGEALASKHGDFLAMSPYMASLPYMCDRASAAPAIRAALQEGYVLCNRYTSSNMAHQVAKVKPSQRKKLLRYLEKAEHDELGVPRPDYVIYLSLPQESAHELIKTKEKRVYMKGQKFGRRKHDAAESDREHQTTSAEIYQQLAEERDNWYAVPCCDKKGKLFTPDEIRHKILHIVLPKVDEELLRCMMK